MSAGMKFLCVVLLVLGTAATVLVLGYLDGKLWAVETIFWMKAFWGLTLIAVGYLAASVWATAKGRFRSDVHESLRLLPPVLFIFLLLGLAENGLIMAFLDGGLLSAGVIVGLAFFWGLGRFFGKDLSSNKEDTLPEPRRQEPAQPPITIESFQRGTGIDAAGSGTDAGGGE